MVLLVKNPSWSKEPELEHVLDALDPGLVRGIADHLLELGEILGEQRLGELGEIQVTFQVPDALLDLLEQQLQVEVLPAHGLTGLVEGVAQAVVEGGPVQLEELIEGRNVLRLLHHGGPQRVLKDLPIPQGKLVEGLEGIDRLRHRHPHSALPEQVREVDDLPLH
jgi:hypothetical protein